MPDTAPDYGPDSRPARSEALRAAALWLVALIVTVGLSTWIGSQPMTAVLGVPRWAAYGVFVPWAVFFVLHVRLWTRRAPDERKS